MKQKGSITVFSALTFMMIASFLFALLEAGRAAQLKTYADMTSELAVESVCAEYQPALWKEYRLLGLDGAYGGAEFSMEHVTAVLESRIRDNLTQQGTGGAIMGLQLDGAAPLNYRLLTDGDGSVFLACVTEYMKENIPIEAARILYERYKQRCEVENSGQGTDSVENAQTAIEEAKRQKQEEVEAEGGDVADAAVPGPEEVDENPLELVLALKQNALLSMVTGDAAGLSTKALDLSKTVSRRTCESGTMGRKPDMNWYDRVLVLEYIDAYFGDYLNPETEHALSYELEYILCGKETDKDNLEATVGRLLLIREAANVTHILGDSSKRASALSIANALAGFTGNPVVIQVVQIGIVAAWAYVESILDIRALLAGDKIALLKSDAQWNTWLGGLAQAFGDGGKAKSCENGFSYQEYVKGFLITMSQQKIAYRMMDVMEQTIQQISTYRECRMDHLLCEISYKINYAANSLFSRFSLLNQSELPGLSYQTGKKFTYY